MIEFASHPECTNCPLHESSRSPGIPTRTLCKGQKKTKERALVVVGQSSGNKEDIQGESFVGYTGLLLTEFIQASGLLEYVDIFLTNALRCRPPQGANETQGQMKKCRPYLVEDVAKIRKEYGEVIVLMLGSKACFSAGGSSSLTAALKVQGRESEVLDGVRVFATYHPAILHPSRRPDLIRVVESHFRLLVRYLKGEKLPSALDVRPEQGIPIPKSAERAPVIGNDIETYGILKGVDQTVFCPHKSKYVDGVPFDKQVVTVGFSWECDEERRIRTATYRWDVYGHRQIIRKWFRMIVQRKKVLLGQHIKFDLMYQYMADSQLAFWIDPNKLRVDDTLLTSFLLYEHQPEKGLKEMCQLHGIMDYSTLLVTGRTGVAKNSKDPDLHLYQAVDCWATVALYRYTMEQIAKRYGGDSPKLGEESARMRNMVVWDVFDLELNGSTFDVPRLRRFNDEQETRCGRLRRVCEGRGLKLDGKGSEKPLREFVWSCLEEAGLLHDDRVLWTKKKGDLSVSIANCNLAMEGMTKDSPLRAQLKKYLDFKRRSKLISTYSRPLLTKPQQGIVTIKGRRGMVWPSWYMVPLYNEAGGSDEGQGGQIQGRFSVKKPARQTEPPQIRECAVSRWSTGRIVEYDVAQDHLRMAALLSGDPKLMRAYNEEGAESLHTQTARGVFPEHQPEKYGKAWKETVYYKSAKTLNFLMLFGGSAHAFQRSALEDAGVELELDLCSEAIKRWYSVYEVYGEWQRRVYREACATGHMIIPTGWSRTFGPPGSDLSAFRGEILNSYHQIPCAQLLQSSHFGAQCEFRKRRLRSKICLQVYDSLKLDCHFGEEAETHDIMDRNMGTPPLLPVFWEWCGREVKWDYDAKT